MQLKGPFMSRVANPRLYTNELFETNITPVAGQRIITLGVAAPLVAAWTHTVGATGHVYAVEHWFLDLQALLQEKKRLGRHPLTVSFSSDLSSIEEECDLCVIDVSSYASNTALLSIVRQAAGHLRNGGLLYVAGPKEASIMAAERRMNEMFGHAEPLAYRKGQRIVMSVIHHEAMALVPELATTFVPIQAHGHTWQLAEQPAIFARGLLDDATAMLIDAMEIKPTDRVLDLGCGSGIVGMVSAMLAPEQTVTLVDSDAYAIDTAKQNCEQNSVANVRIIASDVTSVVALERFTVVICNPPFHQRHTQQTSLADRFIESAYAVLEPKGRLFFVANRFLPYESKLTEKFGEVTEIAGDERYKVLRATKVKVEKIDKS